MERYNGYISEHEHPLPIDWHICEDFDLNNFYDYVFKF